MTNLVSHMSI